jgi:hypothetical protein
MGFTREVETPLPIRPGDFIPVGFIPCYARQWKLTEHRGGGAGLELEHMLGPRPHQRLPWRLLAALRVLVMDEEELALSVDPTLHPVCSPLDTMQSRHLETPPTKAASRRKPPRPKSRRRCYRTHAVLTNQAAARTGELRQHTAGGGHVGDAGGRAAGGAGGAPRGRVRGRGAGERHKL